MAEFLVLGHFDISQRPVEKRDHFHARLAHLLECRLQAIGSTPGFVGHIPVEIVVIMPAGLPAKHQQIGTYLNSWVVYCTFSESTMGYLSPACFRGSQYLELIKLRGSRLLGSTGGLIFASLRASECASANTITPTPPCRTISTPSYIVLKEGDFMEALGHQQLELHVPLTPGCASPITKLSDGEMTDERLSQRRVVIVTPAMDTEPLS